MTYGWAILVVLVAISALAYFGVLDMNRFLPATCDLPTGLSCLDHKVEYVDPPGLNRLTIHLKNNLGYKIDITNIEIVEYGKSQPLAILDFPNGAKSGAGTPPIPNIIVNDATRFAINGALEEGDKYYFTVKLTITNTETDLTHYPQGIIRGKVE